jgi:diguanylate cyclase (GGDEF)-like protein
MDMINAEGETSLILIADDDPMMRFQLKRVLEQEGHRVAEAQNGQQCLDLYLQISPDLVLLDALMPVIDGFDCCAKLQTLPVDLLAPVLMITGLDDTASIDRAFEVGATDYATKPFHWAVLRQRVQRLIQQFWLQQQQRLLQQQLETSNQLLQRLASVDELTQVANRRRFDRYLEQEWQRMLREKQPIGAVFCDIDYFKAYNDSYGHQAGDSCLQRVAGAITVSTKRPADLVTRYGGEEFAVILPNTNAAGTFRVAERIRLAVKALQVPHCRSLVADCITLSLGTASLTPTPDLTPVQLIAIADRALYRAKQSGRDRVVVESLS